MKLSGGMTLIVVGAFCATTAGAERMEPLRILQEYTKTREATQRHIVESEELRENTDTAFYIGKVAAARYFIKHVLPEVDAAVKAIRSEDLSMIDIPEESF